MADPRKPVHVMPSAQQAEVRASVHRCLLAATEVGAREINATGVSFVVIGTGIWAAELAELDARATAKFLRGVADIFDPKTNQNQKRRAEESRAQAVRALYAALDLEMAEAKGNG
ncbi:hypothetical protein [Neoaquamicrobium sediminum]|uniref:hypothetical protein n=1 Tax=Neoaquamicrobium sediminum TaxID=1849104 RepID=UPI003BAC20E0